MSKKRRDLILHQRVQRLADEHNCSVADVNAVLDHHPIQTDRERYLKRLLGLEILNLDQPSDAFREKALVDHDTAAGTLLVKIAERKAMLLGLNAPVGYAVQVIQPAPEHQETSVDRIEKVLKELKEMDRKNGYAPDDSAH
jgi:hypothetical protein